MYTIPLIVYGVSVSSIGIESLILRDYQCNLSNQIRQALDGASVLHLGQPLFPGAASTLDERCQAVCLMDRHKKSQQLAGGLGGALQAEASLAAECSVTPTECSVTPTECSVAPTECSVTPAECSVTPAGCSVTPAGVTTGSVAFVN